MTRAALELVSHVLCPYAQRVAIVLAEKRLPFVRTDIDLSERPAWFSALSPTGKVPLLRVGEAVLFESAAICDFLDETEAPQLHPQDALQRARHRGWIEFASAMLALIGRLYNAPDSAAFERERAALDARFGVLDAALGAGPYFAGSQFSLVDAAFAPVLRYFEVFDQFVDLRLFETRPALRSWRAALAGRASVVAAVGADYPALLRAFLAARRAHVSTLIA